jgi:hypothetical protein
MGPLSIILGFIIIVLGIFGIASSSMAIQAYNANPNWSPYGNSKIKNSNKTFLIVNIITSIALSGLGGLLVTYTGANC